VWFAKTPKGLWIISKAATILPELETSSTLPQSATVTKAKTVVVLKKN
jgi:hypothetical protein